MSLHRILPAGGAGAAVLFSAFAVAAPGVGASMMSGRASTSSGRALIATAFKDATALKSVRTVAVTKGAGANTSVSDVGRYSGVQTVRDPSGAIARARLIGRTVYVSGNRRGLIHIALFPTRLASETGRRWASFSYPTKAYVFNATDVSLTSTLTTSTLVGTLTVLAPTTIDGQTVTPVTGKLPSSYGAGTGILYLSTGATPLPLGETLKFKHSTTTETFSRWGERISVARPRDVVAFS